MLVLSMAVQVGLNATIERAFVRVQRQLARMSAKVVAQRMGLTTIAEPPPRRTVSATASNPP